MQTARTARLLEALKANWHAEMAGHATHTALAEQENDAQRRNILRGLAAAEQHHAELWAKRIRELNGPTPIFRGVPSDPEE